MLHSTDVGESEEIERRGFGFASMNCASSCIGTEFDDTRLFGVKNEAVLPEPFPNRRVARNRVVLVLKSDDEVSSPGESHPQALSEPDLNLSAHPAPIIQSMVVFSSAIGKRALADDAQGALTNAPPYGDASTF